MPARRTSGRDGPGHAAARLAARQGGAVAHRQLLSLGLTAQQIQRWSAGGRLHPAHEGVYGLGAPVAGADGVIAAAVLAVGDDAVVSHASLQVRLGIAPFDPHARPHVTDPRRSGIEQPGIVVHRVRRLDPQDVVVVRGLPCTTPARLLLDEAERLSSGDLRRLLRELKVRRVLAPGAVEDVLARARGRRGLKPLGALWAQSTGALDRAASAAEADLLGLCSAFAIPEPLINEPVEGAERRWRADALWPVERVVVEVDSLAFHGFDEAFEVDRRKDEDLRAVGFVVLRFSARRLVERPEAVATAITRELIHRRRLLAAGLLPPHPEDVGRVDAALRPSADPRPSA